MVLSFGQTIVILGVAIAVIGPKDVPIIARAAGRLTGKAIGYLQCMRGEVDQMFQKTQAQGVQKELREAMAQLEAIRHEIHSGMSILHSGPLTREVPQKFNTEDSMSFGDGSVSTPRETGQFVQPVTSHQADEFGYKLGLVTQVADVGYGGVEVVGPEPGMLKVKIATESGSGSSSKVHSQATAYARLAKTVSTGGIPQQPLSTAHESGSLRVLPISASMAGLLPDKGPIKGGSDLVVQSLVEKKVAEQALEFFENSELPK